LFEALAVASEYLHPLPPSRRVIRAPRVRRAAVPTSRPLPEEHYHGTRRAHPQTRDCGPPPASRKHPVSPRAVL
jgi:hypothetical protein